nr:radical SAM protein [Candidatus Njordarchaeota archaeon]
MAEPKLREVCLEITNSCPMTCVHCSAFCAIPDGQMTLREIETVIDEAAEMGDRILEISGGEPLTHSRLPQIIKYAKQYELEVRLYTSGLLLSRRILNDLIKSQLDKVIVNLQGATPNVHEHITQTRGSFKKAINAIRMCKDHFWVGVHFVPMKPNYRELKKLIKLCDSLEVKEVAVLRFVPQGRGKQNIKWLELSLAEFSEVINAIIEESHSTSETTIRFGHPFSYCSIVDSSLPAAPCQAGTSTCTIKPNGDVIPCSAFKQKANYVAGNTRTASLPAIWMLSRLWDQFRRFDYRGLRGSCNTCRHVRLCQGGCKAQRILAYDDLYRGPDIHCFTYEPTLIEAERIVATVEGTDRGSSPQNQFDEIQYRKRD